MKIPTICENETNWCLLWVLTIPTNCNKETSKFYLPIMLAVGIVFMTTEKKYKIKYKLQYKCLKFTRWGSEMKWCQTNIVMDIFYIKYVNPKNKGGLTPLHIATINIQSLKNVNIVLQKKFKKRWLLYMIISAIFNLVLQFVPKWQMTK